MAVYLLFQLLLASLIVKGTLPEEQAAALQIASGGIGTLLGGLWAVRVLPWGPVPAAMAAAAGVAVLTALAGFAIYNGVLLTGGTLLRLGVMLAGGFLAGCLSAGRRGGKRRKKSNARSVRRK